MPSFYFNSINHYVKLKDLTCTYSTSLSHFEKEFLFIFDRNNIVLQFSVLIVTKVYIKSAGSGNKQYQKFFKTFCNTKIHSMWGIGGAVPQKGFFIFLDFENYPSLRA